MSVFVSVCLHHWIQFFSKGLLAFSSLSGNGDLFPFCGFFLVLLGTFCGHFFVNFFCGHFLWTLFFKHFFSTFCGYFLLTLFGTFWYFFGIFFGIFWYFGLILGSGATIRICQDIQCLPYAFFGGLS